MLLADSVTIRAEAEEKFQFFMNDRRHYEGFTQWCGLCCSVITAPEHDCFIKAGLIKSVWVNFVTKAHRVWLPCNIFYLSALRAKRCRDTNSTSHNEETWAGQAVIRKQSSSPVSSTNNTNLDTELQVPTSDSILVFIQPFKVVVGGRPVQELQHVMNAEPSSSKQICCETLKISVVKRTTDYLVN